MLSQIGKMVSIFAKVEQSSLIDFCNRGLAQLVEQYPYKVWVGGSSPSASTIFKQNQSFENGFKR